ncbi:MAG: bifunctional UDP-N-acetylmuramoyl-tripeptide:D-alanyl-D-alanine ligase/alanine racemase [Prevotellaceae bacterium]|nr:bifunctional UDP-N-acetylmuramoyl-tripeptide:D-alanyl-D-alanine ligase/alanine racemase [Prevotellaceae bacterium]MDY3855789.1 bifunctional UDP-N-acetylmuramoyl-tripeptide:D-alanyl-D-alanine ligase/alanine racemase [Bacteroidaceae bacterium]
MAYSIEEITSLIGAHRYGNADAEIQWLLTDSRSLTFPETSLFFALRTPIRDGSIYIPQLYRRGVRNFVVSEDQEDWEKRYPDCNFLVTPDSLIALQRLAERHREKFDLPIVAVTGSNGKTIVKEWLYQLLCQDYRVERSPKSYNSQIGVPLSIWLLDQQTQIGIFEAGISQPLEMQRLQDIIQPTIGVITNIGEAHQENFASREAKCLEKLKLFEECQDIVYNEDDPLIAKCIVKKGFKAHLLGWSRQNPNAYLYIGKVEKTDNKSSFTFRYKGTDYQTYIPFTDDASVEDAISALAVSLLIGLKPEVAALRLTTLEPVAMRLEVKQGINGNTLINDSYNNDLTSLDIALDFMNRRQNRKGHTFTLVLSDILQSGMSEEELYTRVAQLVNGRHIDRLVGVGDAIGNHMELFEMERHHFKTTEQLINSGLLQGLRHEVILIKGARAFNFDRITARLEQKVHQTILEVDLNALVANLNHYRSFMKPETKMVCMVKASAYGAGAVEVARTLQDHCVDYLAVAVADEGVTLRRGGISQGIMIMNPELTAFKDMFDYDLEPEVYSFELLDALIRAAGKEGVTNWPVHIKLDTGMHRLGFNPEKDIDRLIDVLKGQNAVIPRSVFSHFVGSDSPDFDDFTRHQFALFDAASRKLQGAFSHKILRHICNSAGIERFPQYHLDMVRLGLGLYGINPINNETIHNVSTLKSVILQIRDVPAEDTVGYSRRGVLKRPSRIAAVPIGYADGLDRHLGCGKAYCLVNGKEAPYVGNICMDVCMIDVTGIDCKVGDEVEIFGNHLAVSRLSDVLGTIPYEVLTSVSERVARVYFQD